MKRMRTTGLSAPPPDQARPTMPETTSEATPAQPPPLWRETAPIVAALLAVLDAAEIAPKAGPALKAYRSAMRRQGEAAVALGGAEALEVVMQQVADADFVKAAAREAIIDMAWAGLPGWRP